MKSLIFIAALAALSVLLPGCDCSREEKAVPEDVSARMDDAAYTNTIIQMRSAKAEVARSIAAVRAEIAALGENPEKRPEYADLTNRLAKCKSEQSRIDIAARMTIRERILKNSTGKGDLKK